MRTWRRHLAIALLGLLLIQREGAAQEGAAAPVPPWGESLPESEPREGHGLFERLREWCDVESAPAPKIWVRSEYVLAWIRSSSLPPLVTTGLTTDKTPGALGLPFTKINYGGNSLDYNDRSGLRITAGGVVSEAYAISVEGSYLTLGGRNQQFFSQSPGNPIIARPFFNAVTNAQDSSLTTYPGFFAGSILIQNSSYLQSEELNAFADVLTADKWRLRGLLGLRHVGLHEGLSIAEASTVTNPGLPQFGQTVQVRDSFQTTNNLYAAQVGFTGEYRFRRFTMELFGKAAVGDVQQRVSIDGTSFAGQTFPGGLLAVASNGGSHVRDQFGVVPEGGVKLQGAICKHVLVHVGYSFLYFGDVVRPGSHVDLTVNPNLVPTSNTFGAGANPARPTFQYRETDYWAHLFNFGLTVQY